LTCIRHEAKDEGAGFLGFPEPQVLHAGMLLPAVLILSSGKLQMKRITPQTLPILLALAISFSFLAATTSSAAVSSPSDSGTAGDRQDCSGGREAGAHRHWIHLD
jgi:hypothetical protein